MESRKKLLRMALCQLAEAIRELRRHPGNDVLVARVRIRFAEILVNLAD